MEPHISSSELTVYSDNYGEKAWHLVSVLLSIGRPASVEELAGKCSLFSASPEFVEFLCSIPNSPILLTENNFVLLSVLAFNAFGEFFSGSMPKLQIGAPGARMLCGNVVRTYFRKRKKFGNELMPLTKNKGTVLNYVSENELYRTNFFSSQRIVNGCLEVADLQTTYINKILNTLPPGLSIKVAFWEYFSNIICMTPSTVNTDLSLFRYQSQNDEEVQGNGVEKNTSIGNDMHTCLITEEYPDECYNDDVTPSGMPGLDKKRNIAPCLECLAEISAMLEKSQVEKPILMDRLDVGEHSLGALDQLDENALVFKEFRNNRVPETRLEELAEQPLVDYECSGKAETFPFGSFETNFSPKDDLFQAKMGNLICGLPASQKPLNIQVGNKSLVCAGPQSITQKYTQSSAVMGAPQGELSSKKQAASKAIQQSKVDIVTRKRKIQKDQNMIAMKHKSKQFTGTNALIEERCENVHKSSRDLKTLPEFESYIVEEEEGSGGYGTVYRARRKTDAKTFAIKCPHVNAHKHHVKNELKMLERFGGRNFVIKYEGSFKNAGSDCFVLEHVEHDRAEVLKREMNIYQLQWYGYCMFRALASLHRQGVLHRDVKPGNFLFSCKTMKGYLIDFNLAKDLHQKHESIDKSQTSHSTSIQHMMGLQSKSVSPNKRRKILGGKSIDTFKENIPSGSSPEGKTMKKKAVDKLKAYNGLGLRNSITSQGADASGLTSTKDVTPSGERLREPLPCQGRKELINLAQEAMQSPNLGVPSTPASNRKRVVASPGILDRKLIYLTPMPLHSSGVAISGAGSLKNRGEVKSLKEGPCAGTKGFRAPEVLLRSLHQGPKADVWSAGVTLLYLITGKLPFTGDPEQNMKDIVKMRGNEELWELSKLHNRESSLPVDLLDVRYLPSMKIKVWCAANTKRPDFQERIPGSLFDLIEKCLTVNPRLRISAEEALRHEFFAPCHDALQKQRSMRRPSNHESKSNCLTLVREFTRPVNLARVVTPVKKTESSAVVV